MLQEARHELQSSFAMTDLGQTTRIIGTDIMQDLAKGTITLSQEIYSLCAIGCFEIDICNPVQTPGIGVDTKVSQEDITLFIFWDSKEGVPESGRELDILDQLQQIGYCIADYASRSANVHSYILFFRK